MKQVINCKYNNEVFERDGVIEISPHTTNITLTIGVNGDYNCHDFIIANSGDSWVIYKVVNNTIYVTIKSNFTSLRESSLYIMHKLNNLVQTIITFRQSVLDYELILTDKNDNVINNNHEIYFNNLLKHDDDKQELYTINYNCKNGNLIVKPIKMFVKSGTSGSFYERVYDNGFVIHNNGTDKLDIINYGKPNLYADDEFYYQLTLQHSRDISVKYNIKIYYKSESDFSF